MPRVMVLRPPRCRVASAALTPHRSCNSSRSRQALLSKACRVRTMTSTSFAISGLMRYVHPHTCRQLQSWVQPLIACAVAEELNRAIDYYMPSSSEDDDDDADETAQPASAAAAPPDASQASSGTDADEHKRSRRYGWRTSAWCWHWQMGVAAPCQIWRGFADPTGMTRSASAGKRSVTRSGRSPKRMQTRC